MRDAAWYASQLAHCEAVLEHIDREHEEHEREAARKQLDEYERKAGRLAPRQNELELAA